VANGIIKAMIDNFTSSPRAACTRPAQYGPPLAAAAIALWLYASTAAPWLSWANDGADGGDLIAATVNWGVPHPTGYPTYCLLARLFAFLPLGTVARRFNLFSATAAAAAVALVCLSTLYVLQRAPGRPTWLDSLISLVSALACAAGPTLWSQATIAEVYALHSLFCALCLYLGLRNDLLVQSRWWWVLGLALGLGLGVHLTLLLMLPGLTVLVWPRENRRHLLALAAGALLGLAVYTYLPLAARMRPTINWGDASSWSGFWWVISGEPYHTYAFALPTSHLLARLSAWARLVTQQYTPPGVVLGALGLCSWIEKRRYKWTLGTTLTFIAHTIYAISYNTADSYVYLIPTYLVTAIWIAEGARAIITGFVRGNPRRWQRRIALSLVVFAAIPLYSTLCHYDKLDLSDDRAAANWVDDVLGQIPEGALLITSQDRHTFTLDYVQWVEHRRQDLLVIDADLLGYDWYAGQTNRRHPSQNPLESKEPLIQLISGNLGQREVYLATPREAVMAAFQVTRCGSLWRITGQN